MQFRLVVLDVIILILMPLLAVQLRFEGDVPANELAMLATWLPVHVAAGVAVFYVCGMYRRIWHYARIRDLLAIVGAVTFSMAAILAFSLMSGLMLPRSVYFNSWVLEICAVGGLRLAFKIRLDWYNPQNNSENDKKKAKMLIVGAGDAGAMLLREIEQNDSASVEVVGFLDDDEAKVGSVLSGFPVLARIGDCHKVVEENEVDEIVIAIPSAEGGTIRHIVNECSGCGCHIKIMPGIYELLGSSFGRTNIRDIRLEDLLRRDPIKLDFEQIAKYLKGKVVLITGAGGSIGSEISRQISCMGAEKIILLGRGENSIYEISNELRDKFPDQAYRAVIANVTDEERMEDVFREYRPNVVFHAAAHKHVPLMEAQPAEAVKNNVFGTKIVAQLADKYKAETFVLISTDKAVNPTSVMGATKRVAELVLQEINQHSRTKFVTVRFGNVLGSRGSVVPLFEKQIAAGGPVTITHPEMTRFFMTIPEAVQLVLQAGSQANGGEVFLLDMGEPVKIKDMACDLIRLHGLVPDKDIKLVYTGLRPGEKLYEELLTAEEGTTSTQHSKIFKAKIQALEKHELDKVLRMLRVNRDKFVVLKTLKEIIPEYKSKQLEDMLERDAS